jgi:perosamine synthetase
LRESLEFIPYGQQDIDDRDISAVVDVLKGDFLTQGPSVDVFEETFGKFVGAKHVVAVSNGTAGLHLAYLAAGIGPGDAVIVPAITFAATANAVLYCGGTPIFADIDPSTLCISSTSISRCIEIARSAGLNTKCIAPVHFAGLPCDMGPIMEIARKENLIVIEDACHAFGAEYHLPGRKAFQRVGSIEDRHMTVFSFHPVKHMTTAEGGVVTTSDTDLGKKLRMLRTHGITKFAPDFLNRDHAFENGLPNPWYNEMQMLGLNYRLCDIQAALGTSQLSRASAFVARRKQIAAIYDDAFKNQTNIIPAPSGPVQSRHSYHLYPLQLNFEKIGLSRRSFMGSLKEMGIGSQVHYLPVPWHPFYEQNPKLWMADSLTNAPSFYQAELSIPMYSKMSDEMVSRVIRGVMSLI